MPAPTSNTDTIDGVPRLMFANLLRELMLEKRITASELARKVWGTTKDYRGYTVAKNRDRIGHYLSGKSYPEKDNLQKIAKALGVPFERLAATQPIPSVREARSPKDIELIVHATGPLKGAASLSLHKVDLTLANAMKIMELLKEDPIYEASKNVEDTFQGAIKDAIRDTSEKRTRSKSKSKPQRTTSSARKSAALT